MVCDVKMFNCGVGSSSVRCNLNPTNYKHYSACNVECGRNTHTHESNDTQLHAHRQSKQSPEEKRWLLRADSNDATGDIYLL